MMLCLLVLILVSQVLYLGISWSKLIPYLLVANKASSDAETIQTFAKYDRVNIILTGAFIFFFITEHAYFAVKHWALSMKIDSMID